MCIRDRGSVVEESTRLFGCISMPGLVRDIWMKVRIRKQMELRICNDNAFGNYSVLAGRQLESALDFKSYR